MGRAPDTLTPADTWRTGAACRAIDDPDLFYPIGTGPEALAQTQQALDLCTACPVIRICLERALVAREQDGIWGGTTEEERRRMLRNWRKRRPITPAAAAENRAVLTAAVGRAA